MALTAAAAAVQQQQQQHTAVHNHQATNTQASALGHTGWSPAVGALAAPGHHTVVTDHSTLAYMNHAYQNTSSSVNDHRNASGPIAHQPIGTGHQASTYTVDSNYITPAAAAAYGYNNYGAAFFQTSNNSPQSTGLSGFWNPGQNAQQRTNQGVSNQTTLQQRQQQMTTDPVSGYMQDPRLYYGRPPYGQVMQNFSQHQPHSTHQQQQQHQHQQQPQQQAQHQPDMGERQQMMIHDHHMQQYNNHQHLSSHQSQQSLQSTPSITSAVTHTKLQDGLIEQNDGNKVIAAPQNLPAKKAHPPRESLQAPVQKLPSSDMENSHSVKNQLDFEPVTVSKNLQTSNNNQRDPQQNLAKDLDTASARNSQSNYSKEQSKQAASNLPAANKTQTVVKNEPDVQYQSQKKPNSNNVAQQNRKVYRPSHDERMKPQPDDLPTKQSGDTEMLLTAAQELKNPPANKSQEIDRSASIEDSLATLAISSRKTTWASIASQPAKVAQPKSLKSKIAGSNSVLSSAKHLASSVTLDSSSLESKNGINPAIKSSVSIAATSLPRGSVPAPISKIASAAVANLKLDLLGDENMESSKISWPAVNASMNLKLEEPPVKKENSAINPNLNSNMDRQRRDDDSRSDSRDAVSRGNNNNQGVDAKMVNSYHHQQVPRDDRRDDLWSARRDQRDHRIRRDSDFKESDQDKRLNHDDVRHQLNQRRDYKSSSRLNHFRNDDAAYRDRDHRRGAILDRNEYGGNDSYRYQPGRFDHPRDSHQSTPPLPHQQPSNKQNDNAPHHHYNNLRDGNQSRGVQSKLDISLHPHLNPANYNPKEFNFELDNARYFIIKSYSEDDIHRSIKYSIWCSTNHGNKRLDEAYRQQQAKNGQLFLFFSVNGSGHFCGMAQMTSGVDFDSSSGVWAQSKWQGEFSVKWIYVKDVPNSALRHITLENNENKPVTNSRDTQEVPSEKGKSVLKIIHQYSHTTSLFDDFLHYERRQEEEKMKKSLSEQQPVGRPEDKERGRYNRPYTNQRIHNEFRDRPGSRDRPSRYLS